MFKLLILQAHGQNLLGLELKLEFIFKFGVAAVRVAEVQPLLVALAAADITKDG
jgi:hypothetical protein